MLEECLKGRKRIGDRLALGDLGWTLWTNIASPKFQEPPLCYLVSGFRVRTLGRSRGIYRK